MAYTVRQFVDDLGGYRAVAMRLGVKSTTLHSHMTAGLLPPKWYVALCELAREKRIMAPSPYLFDFKPLVAATEQEDAA
jgi:hypothetical protein